MTVRKFAVSFPVELHRLAQQAAAEEGLSLSAWLARASEHELRHCALVADGLAAIGELEAAHGAITPSAEDRSWVADVLASASGQRRLAG
ncbi:MAG: hypothetical protein M0T80_03480 [Actinomycetota bacterium]|nr:hypothetical protein [Actinomycetota bacterium]